MALFEWTPALSVGIASIDRQHQILINQINTLAEVVEGALPLSELDRVLDGLQTYTQVHFAYEELLFSLHQYQSRDEHEGGHHAFVKLLERCRSKLALGDRQFGDELLQYLKKWLTEHILVEDIAYVGFLKSKGVD